MRLKQIAGNVRGGKKQKQTNKQNHRIDMQQGVCLDPRVLQAQLGQRRPLKHQAFFTFIFFVKCTHYKQGGSYTVLQKQINCSRNLYLN